MPAYMAKTNVKAELGSPAYTVIGRSAVDLKITHTENGFPVASVVFHKPQNTLLSNLLKSALIKLYVKDGSEVAWTKMFSGKIRFLKKGLDAQGGSLVTAKCDGSGYGFAEMVVGEEYGAQSINKTVKTMKQILTDSTIGIVPKWVNKILNTAVASGYAYDTSSMDDITGDVPYQYYPFKPASKALGDLLDIVQAIKGANPGPHWLVNTDDKLLVTTVAGHSAAAIAAGWPTYMGASLASATLQEGRDFYDFVFDDQTESANYILYHSKFQWPGSGDLTETYPVGDWVGDNFTVGYSTSADPKVGNQCLTAESTSGGATGLIDFCRESFLHLDLSKAGGQYSIPEFGFWMRRGANTPASGTILLHLCNNYAHTVYFGGTIDIASFLPQIDKWFYVEMPVGPYWYVPQYSGLFSTWFDPVGGADWTDINWIRWVLTTGNVGAIHSLDGLRIAGTVLRAAYNSTLIGSSQAKMRIVSDEYAKGDTLIPADDSGTIALLAKAELLRQMQTSRVATFSTKLIRAALPGQLVHMHARPAAGVYEIDADYRITQLVHSVTAAATKTSFSITDDLTNSISRAAFDSINEITKSFRPEFQDRQASGIKLRDIDITQVILEKDYP